MMSPSDTRLAAVAFLSLISGAVCWADDTTHSPDRTAPVTVSKAALELHHSSLVFDGHNDLPWELRTKFGSSFDAADIAQPQPRMQTDIPRLRAGGVGAQFWSVYVPSDTAGKGT